MKIHLYFINRNFAPPPPVEYGGRPEANRIGYFCGFFSSLLRGPATELPFLFVCVWGGGGEGGDQKIHESRDRTLLLREPGLLALNRNVNTR
jgi:hypothetical protein